MSYRYIASQVRCTCNQLHKSATDETAIRFLNDDKRLLRLIRTGSWLSVLTYLLEIRKRWTVSV